MGTRGGRGSWANDVRDCSLCFGARMGIRWLYVCGVGRVTRILWVGVRSIIRFLCGVRYREGPYRCNNSLLLGGLCCYDPYESGNEPYLHSVPHCIYSECFTMERVCWWEMIYERPFHCCRVLEIMVISLSILCSGLRYSIFHSR